MKNRIIYVFLLVTLLFVSCNKSDADGSSSKSSKTNSNQVQPGVFTAGEWNDLDNWRFWDTIINKVEYKNMPAYWRFYTNNRVVVNVLASDSTPIINVTLKLKRQGLTIFTAKTDNKGRAELFADLNQGNSTIDFSKLTIDVDNGSSIVTTVKPFTDGVNKIILAPKSVSNKVEIAFVVDATGSMGDELEYLKRELLDVITRAKNANTSNSFLTSSVFYRDEGDEYLTRVSNFSANNNTTIDFIKNQKADGGGDFPEAVHTALDKAINELQWSTNAKTRIMFLILDAPPHYKNDVVFNIQNSISKAAEKGIKLIPITASGIDKETEFLMRFMSISTNGTYVFITNHSGIGNNHLEPTVGQYQVEFLNNLMVRLINKYSQ